MGRVTMFLNTNAETFTRWLESSYQSVVIESSLPWSRLRLHAERHTAPGGAVIIEWGGDSVNRDAEGKWIAEPLSSPVIWFGMTSLDNGIEVQAGCMSIDAMVCFLEILGDIVHPQRWPGVREDVLKYLGEVARAEETWKYFDKRVIDKAQALRAQLLAQQEVEGPGPRPDASEPARAEGVGRRKQRRGPYSGTNKDLTRVAKQIIDKHQRPKPACEYEGVQYATFDRWFKRAVEVSRLIKCGESLSVALEQAGIPETTYKILEPVVDHLS